ncbi:MAG TPA: ABC transporter substrate-binding protein, partial [Acidisphaera sp.]|nr:ABC transporter substrate-binding protein [Acidisphaera sp.]
MRAWAFAVCCVLLAVVARAADTPEPVKLGAILDMSSVYADVTGAGSQAAAQMAIDDFGGKVLGRRIQLMVADHQNKPDIAAGVAARWLDAEHVSAILDVAASGPALAVMNVAKTRDAIVLLSGPGASSITGEQCIPNAVHWAYNTYALAHSTGSAIVAEGGKTWYFIAADYTFGAQLEADTAAVVKAAGGQVLGDTKAPIGTSDFSSYLLSAQQSGAQVVGFANAGADLDNAIKQAADFGLARSGQRLAGLLVYINDIHSLGLAATHGVLLSSAFYWDMNDATRAFAKRFYDKMRKMPNMSQAGLYSATLHYLKAVEAAGTLESKAVMAQMRAMPVNDFFTHNGTIRADGMMVHDMYLFQVKAPEESHGEWDLYTLVRTIPADQAYLPLSQSRCPLVHH